VGRTSPDIRGNLTNLRYKLKKRIQFQFPLAFGDVSVSDGQNMLTFKIVNFVGTEVEAAEGAPARTMSVAASRSDGGSQAAQTDGNFLTALTDFASLFQVVPALNNTPA